MSGILVNASPPFTAHGSDMQHLQVDGQRIIL